jgi:hypothetical protein
MVRVKSRWIVIDVRFERDLLSDNPHDSHIAEYFPSKRDLGSAIRDNIVLCSGEAVSSACNGAVTQGMSASFLKRKIILFHRFLLVFLFAIW